MSGVEVASIIGVILIGLGLIATWVKNGRGQAKEFGALQENLKSVNDKLADPSNGLGALNTKMGKFQTTCAFTRASYDQKIKGAEEDIKELKKEKR